MYNQPCQRDVFSSLLILVMATTVAGCLNDGNVSEGNEGKTPAAKGDKASLVGKWEAEGGKDAVWGSAFLSSFELLKNGALISEDINMDKDSWPEPTWKVKNGRFTIAATSGSPQPRQPTSMTIVYDYTRSDSTLILANAIMTVVVDGREIIMGENEKEDEKEKWVKSATYKKAGK